MGGDSQELRSKAGWVLTELKHGVTTKVAQEMSGKQGVLLLQALTRTPPHTHTQRRTHTHTCTHTAAHVQTHIQRHARAQKDVHTGMHTHTADR